MAGGLPGDTPVAAVRWGTRPDQRTVRTTLGVVGSASSWSPPVTIVIGRVAGLDLAWFESRPLFGRRVVVTRARIEAGSGLGAARGARRRDGGAARRSPSRRCPSRCPTCRASCGRAHVGERGPRLFERAARRRPGARALAGLRVAVIGPGISPPPSTRAGCAPICPTATSPRPSSTPSPRRSPVRPCSWRAPAGPRRPAGRARRPGLHRRGVAPLRHPAGPARPRRRRHAARRARPTR